MRKALEIALALATYAVMAGDDPVHTEPFPSVGNDATSRLVMNAVAPKPVNDEFADKILDAYRWKYSELVAKADGDVELVFRQVLYQQMATVYAQHQQHLTTERTNDELINGLGKYEAIQ